MRIINWTGCVIALLFLPGLSVNAQHCIDCGQAINGNFYASRDTVITSGSYEFDSFIIEEGVSVSVSGSQPLQIKCKSNAEIYGVLNLSGGNGGEGLANLAGGPGGTAVAGGYNGGNGQYNIGLPAMPGLNGNGPGYGPGGQAGAGAGAGYSNYGLACNTPGGMPYGDSSLSNLSGGSGGGGGMALYNGVSGGGGAGGGILLLRTCASLILGHTGKILSNGGHGGNGTATGFPGGGGSGGSIYLAAKEVFIHGEVSASGGKGGIDAGNDFCNSNCHGSPGRIRIDSNEELLEGIITPSAYFYKLFHAGISRSVPVKCHGTATGFIKARANGGEKPYTYLWSNGSQSNFIDNIPAGTYTVTITDGNGCSYTDQETLSQPDPITAHSVTYPATCESKDNGQLILQASGGNPYPYQKSLVTTMWSNNSSHGLMFDFTVNTRVSLKRITVGLPSPSQQLISIYFKQGSMAGAEHDSTRWTLLSTYTVNGSGNNEETPLDLSMLNSLLPGRYSFYIFNHSASIKCVNSNVVGSTFNFDHILTIYDGLGRNSSSSPFSASVKGTMNLAGKITYVVRQENDFEYNFTAAGTNHPLHTAMPPGLQPYTVTDALGCFVSGSVNIPEAGKMDVILDRMIAPSCSNSSDGEIEIHSVPAVNVKYCATAIPSNIPSHGFFLNFNVLNPVELSGLDIFIKQSGLAELYIKQGTYAGSELNPSSWTHLGNYPVNSSYVSGISSIQLANKPLLSPGDWSIYLYSTHDLFRNLDSISQVFTNDIHLGLSSSRTGQGGAFVTQPKQNAHFAGTIRYQLTNNTLQYLWNTNTSGNNISNLTAGIYNVQISHDKDCIVTKSFSLTAPAPISITKNIIPETESEQNGQLTIQISGGTAPYFIQWLHNGSTGHSLHQLSSGTYPVFIADAHGCTILDSIFIYRIADPVVSVGQLQIAPNPGHGQFVVVKDVKGMEVCTLRIFDKLGRLTYQRETNIPELMSEGVNVSHFADGTYFVQVNDEDQVFHARFVIIR